MVNFSVCMSVYNGDNADYFQLALLSLLNQTIKPSEIVLVVDGPVNDMIEDVIDSFIKKSDLLNVIRIEKNSGHAIARQTGLDAAKFDYVAIMDSDDIAKTDRFEKQIRFIEENPDLDVVGGQIEEFVGIEDNIVGKRVVPVSDNDIKKYMLGRCPMNQQTVMFKKASVLKVGGYIDWYCEEDYFLWIRMMKAGCRFANLQDTLVNVRVGGDMYARRGGMKYFKSEAKLQKYMWDGGIISFPRYSFNVLIRLCVQVLMPNWLRGFVFQKLFRD